MKKIFLSFVLLFLGVLVFSQMGEKTVTQTLYRAKPIKNFYSDIKDASVTILFLVRDTDSDEIYSLGNKYAKVAGEKYPCAKKGVRQHRKLDYKDSPKEWSLLKEQATSNSAPYVLVLKADKDTTISNITSKIVADFSGQQGDSNIEKNVRSIYNEYCK